MFFLCHRSRQIEVGREGHEGHEVDQEGHGVGDWQLPTGGLRMRAMEVLRDTAWGHPENPGHFLQGGQEEGMITVNSLLNKKSYSKNKNK